MATRIYLPNTGTAPITNATNDTWTETTGFDRIAAVTSRISSAMTSKVQAHTATAANSTFLSRQYVIGPLAGQTFGATTVKGTIRVLESAANDNLDAMRMSIRVVAPDGTTFRTAIWPAANSTVAEFNTTLRAKRLATGGTTTSSTITEGDYLIIEIGTTSTVGGTSLSDTISYGDNSATDLGDNETDTAANNPFIELAANLIFLQRGYGQAQADIKVTSNQFAQAQTYVGHYQFAQAQADIKVITNQFAQANTQIKIVGLKGFAQANTLINGTYFLPFLDTFTRTVVDGLGISDNGDTWTLVFGSASNFDTNGSTGTLVQSGATAQIMELRKTLILSRGYEFSGSVSADKLPAGTTFGLIWGVQDLYNSTSNKLTFSLIISPTTINIISSINGITTASPPDVSYSINTTYNFKIQVFPVSNNKTEIREKIWNSSSIEPGWFIDESVSSNPLIISHPSLWVNSTLDANVPFTWTFDNLQIQAASLTYSAQAQAQIKVTTNVYAQAQAKINSFGVNRFAQAQAKINSFGVNQFAQAQTYIRPRVGLGQAQAFLNLRFAFAQAAALVNGTYFLPFSDTFTRTVSNNLGVSDNGDTWTLVTGTATNASVDGSQGSIITSSSSTKQRWQLPATLLNYAQGLEFSGTIKVDKLPSTSQVTFGFVAKSPTSTSIDVGLGAAITVTTTTMRVFAARDTSYTSNAAAVNYTPGDTYNFKVQVISVSDNGTQYYLKLWKVGDNEPGWADIRDASTPLSYRDVCVLVESHNVIANAPFTWTFDNLQVIEAGLTKVAQAQADIKITTTVFGQAQAKITAGTPTQSASAQAQVDINATTNAFAQSNTDIKAATSVFAQAQADIDVVTNAFSQAQADIVSITNAFSQSQADIKATSNAFAQAQSDINAVNNGFAQSNTDIKAVTTQFAQAQVCIVAWRFANAQADIKAVSTVFGQSQADINATTNQFSQAQADIKVTTNVFAQSQTDIRVTSNGFAQSQSDIKQTYNGCAQAQASILATSYGFSQAQSDIKQTYTAFAQSQADIKQTYSGFGQAQADISQTFQGYAQAQSDILVVTNGFAQAQSRTLQVYQGYAQAQATILQVYSEFAQANADVLVTNQRYAQAQCLVTFVQHLHPIADITTNDWVGVVI